MILFEFIFWVSVFVAYSISLVVAGMFLNNAIESSNSDDEAREKIQSWEGGTLLAVIVLFGFYIFFGGF